MYQTYIAIGLDPARFWEVSPRLLTIEIRGAQLRMRREAELTWFSAMLPHLQNPPTLEAFSGRPVDHEERARRVNAAWDRIDRSLARNVTS